MDQPFDSSMFVPVIDQELPDPVSDLTSTATILLDATRRLYPDGTWRAGKRLRMFGPTNKMLPQYVQGGPGWQQQQIQSVVDAACSRDRLGFCFLDSWTQADDFALDIYRPVDNLPIRGTNYVQPVLFKICVPSSKVGVTWPYERVTSYTTTPPNTERASLPAGYVWDVQYGGPTVVRVPHGQGWLLICARLMKSRAADAPEIAKFDITDSLHDLVQYHCRSPDFDHTTRGPYLLVSGLAALPPQEGRAPPNFRCSMDVPRGGVRG